MEALHRPTPRSRHTGRAVATPGCGSSGSLPCRALAALLVLEPHDGTRHGELDSPEPGSVLLLARSSEADADAP